MTTGNDAHLSKLTEDYCCQPLHPKGDPPEQQCLPYFLECSAPVFLVAC